MIAEKERLEERINELNQCIHKKDGLTKTLKEINDHLDMIVK